MNLDLFSIAYPVTSLGPGRRLALWVAGCPLGCKGCITPELWNREAGQTVTVERVLERMLAIELPLDGISLTGGEPFEQPRALAWLLRALAEERPHWSVMTFSGYALRELHKKGEHAQMLLSAVDVLIAGRYVQKRPSSLPLVASTNQKRYYLTRRGRSMRRAVEAIAPDASDLAVGPEGKKLLVGVLGPEDRARIHEQLRVEDRSSDEHAYNILY